MRKLTLAIALLIALSSNALAEGVMGATRSCDPQQQTCALAPPDNAEPAPVPDKSSGWQIVIRFFRLDSIF